MVALKSLPVNSFNALIIPILRGCLQSPFNRFLTVTCFCCPYLFFGSAIMLVTYFVNFRKLNDHLFGKELFIWFTACAFRKLLSVYVFSYFPFGFEDRMWDLIVSVPDHCLSFYFDNLKKNPVFNYMNFFISDAYARHKSVISGKLKSIS